MTTTLYGISNCDTVRKARRWCSDNAAADVLFHDVRKDGLTAAKVNEWLNQADWNLLLNKRGTTWRKLPEAVREATDASNVAALLVEHPALIKRPVLEHNKQLEIGFKPDRYAQIFA